jgi:type IV pilus assembly protein PilX
MSNPIHQLTERQPVTTLPVQGKKQRGAVLIISLIILLLMTLIGTAGMQNTSLEEKMAGNMRDRNLAFQAAESALRAGETFLITTATAALPAFNCTNGYFQAPAPGKCSAALTPVWDNINWTAINSQAFVGILANLNANPRYIIEDMGVVPDIHCMNLPTPPPCTEHYYRITARAIGGTATTVVMTQSILQR